MHVGTKPVRLSEKPLVIFSRTDGPLVRVAHLREVEVRDGNPDDVIEVHFVEHTLMSQPEPLLVAGGRRRKTNFPGGLVKVKRLKGTSPITVIGYCEVR